MRLTLEKKYRISTLYANKESKTKMANHIRVNYSTVFREIKRNASSLGYDHKQAHEKAKSGLNENTNSLARQYFPKGLDFRAISQQEAAVVEKKLNSQPL